MSKRSAVVAYHETTTPGAYVKTELFHHKGKGYMLMVTPVNVEFSPTGFMSEGFTVFEWSKHWLEQGPAKFSAKRLAQIVEVTKEHPEYNSWVETQARSKGWALTGEALSAEDVKIKAVVSTAAEDKLWKRLEEYEKQEMGPTFKKDPGHA